MSAAVDGGGPLIERKALRELVGVTFFTDSLKKLLLLFDRVACPQIEYFRTLSPNEFGDLRWLVDRGLVLTPAWTNAPPRGAPSEWSDALREFDDRLSSFYVTASRANQTDQGALVGLGNSGARALASQLRHVHELNAVPVLAGWSPGLHEPATMDGVCQGVLAALPSPGEHCTFEEIVEFRTRLIDEGAVQELRVWMETLIQQVATEAEVVRVLESKIHEHEQSLREATLLAPPPSAMTKREFADLFVGLRWMRLAGRVADVGRRRNQSLAAALLLPSREVSYIVRARQRFS